MWYYYNVRLREKRGIKKENVNMAKVGRKKREETARVSYRLNAELEQQMREHCESTNQIINRWIEQAIREKLERDNKK